jgi:hypothetical protein
VQTMEPILAHDGTRDRKCEMRIFYFPPA